jgi:hypothetical protein
MTVRTWHMYRLSDGVLTGYAVQLADDDAALLEANTPPGCAAVTGVTDWQAQRVDLATGAVQDWQPPAPPDDAMRTWAWDAQQRRWLPQPTQAALAAQQRAERDRRLAACDWVVLRAAELGEAVPLAWRQYRAGLRDVPLQPGWPDAVNWPDLPA